MLVVSLVFGALTVALIVYIVVIKQREEGNERAAERAVRRAPSHSRDSAGAEMTGDKLEDFCASQLERAQWQVTRGTKEERRSGVSLVARKDALVVALQCHKGWTGVDRRALEKLAAGAKTVGAEFAVLVSNATFTPPLQRVAEKHNIILMNYTELAVFDPALDD